MIEQTVAKIEAALREAQLADPKNKAALIAMLEKLKLEVKNEKRSKQNIDSAGAAVKNAALEFEATHPQLASVISEISVMLAKIGI